MVSLIATNASDICFQPTSFTGTYQGRRILYPSCHLRDGEGGGGREGGREVELELRLGGKSRARGTRTETQRRGKEESLSPRGFATRSHVLSHVLSRLASLASQIEALACGL